LAGDTPNSLPRTKPRFDYHMSIAAARADLGFEPAVKLRDGMAEELAWIRTLDGSGVSPA
jgi:nucleoside-diphosphate-sugar epimerase